MHVDRGEREWLLPPTYLPPTPHVQYATLAWKKMEPREHKAITRTSRIPVGSAVRSNLGPWLVFWVLHASCFVLWGYDRTVNSGFGWTTWSYRKFFSKKICKILAYSRLGPPGVPGFHKRFRIWTTQLTEPPKLSHLNLQLPVSK